MKSKARKRSKKVKVFCRIRPYTSYERHIGIDKSKYDIKLSPKADSLIVFNGEGVIQKRKFGGFNHIFDKDTQQEDFFHVTSQSLVNKLLKGYKNTIIIYGGEASGKTWCMRGITHLHDIQHHYELVGVLPRTVNQIFDHIANSESDESEEYTVSLSYVEVYNDKIKDLFNHTNNNMEIRGTGKSGTFLEGLTEREIVRAEDLHNLLREGEMNITIAMTNMSAYIHRSHTIATVKVRYRNTETGEERIGLTKFVKLAPISTKKTKTKIFIKEQKMISQSVFSLFRCVNAVAGRKRIVPYRESKLTRILQGSLDECVVILTLSRHHKFHEQTMRTLNIGKSIFQ